MKSHNVSQTKAIGLFRQSIKQSRKVAALLLVQAMLSPSAMAAKLSEQILSINHKNVPISVVLNEIEANTGYSFLVRNNDVNINEKITINATNKNLEEILGQLFDKKGIRYTVENNRITIYKAKTSDPQPSVTQSKTRTISGIVTDQTGEPIIGANVVVKEESNIGTSTDFDGNFTLNVPENCKIEITYVGYLSQVLPIKNQSSFQIKLIEDTKALEEVVVVGYATQKKGLLTGSVETMKLDDKLRNIPTTSAGDLLTGKLAGLDIRSGNGIPGSNPEISIRTGSSWREKSQPVMYVIDGIVRGSGDFNNLSPNEIEDITVLKDAAAAAVYGSRSAGGVIVVTTKKGNIGKPTINYSYSYTIDKRTKNMDLTDAVQTYELYNRMSPDPNTNWTQDELDELAKINGGWGYNQLETVYRDPIKQAHNISVSGGNEKVRYFAGGSIIKQDGFLDPLKYDKYNLRLNVTADITKDFQIHTGLAIYNNNIGNIADNESPESTYSKLRIWQPEQPVYTENGQFVDYGWIGNVGARVQGASGYNKSQYLKPQLNISGTYKAPFLKGLSAKVSFARSWTNEIRKIFYTNYDMMVMKKSGTNNHIISIKDDDIINTRKSTWINKDYIERKSGWSDDKQLNFQISYDNVFNEKHRVSGTLVTEWTEGSGSGVTGGREGFPVYLTDQFWAASGIRQDTWGNGDTDWKDGRMSYIGQFSYSYSDKYLLAFSFREDGSMKFAPHQRWGFFPAASAGWIISEENFFNKNKVQFLKLRASWGLTGDDSVGGWQWQESYKAGENIYFGKQPSKDVGITYGSIVNPNLTWEKTRSLNFATDMRILDNWDLTLEYWHRKTYDILGKRNASLPPTFSQTMPDENYGESQSQGIDFKINYNGKTRDFTYNAGLTVSYGWNEILLQDYAENAQAIDIPIGKSMSRILGYEAWGIIRTQEDLDLFNSQHPNGYVYNGLKPELGMLVYKDKSGPEGSPDGIIDSWDRITLRNRNNPVIFGLNLGGSWKGLSIDATFSGKIGEERFMHGLADGVEWNRMWLPWYNDSWTPDNVNASLPKRVTTNGPSSYKKESDFWLEKCNYMRLKYLTVSYELPKDQFYNKIFENVRLFTTGTNLFVLSKFNKQYYDPEIGGGNAFPLLRSISFGVDVRF